MYLRLDQLKGIPFKYLGENVMISDKCSIYNPERISIFRNTRIDDFCILSAGDGGIIIEQNVHLGCYCSLIGKGIIGIGGYTELSGRTSIYSSTNDFDAAFYFDETDSSRMNILSDDVLIHNNVVIGSGSVILPGVIIEEFSRVGAMSLVKDHISTSELWAGVPAKKIRNLYEL